MADKRISIGLRVFEAHLERIDAAVEDHNARSDGTNPESRTAYMVSAALARAEKEAAAAHADA